MIVADATPLIYLAKVNRLELLDIFDEVIIPYEVKAEVVDAGKANNTDAYSIEKLLNTTIKVKQVQKFLDIPIAIHKGEKAVISLAKELRIDEVLMDDKIARNAAELLGLKPRGTIYLLLKALELDKLSLNEFLDTLEDMLRHGFRLKEEILIEVIKKAREIDKL